MGHEAAASGRPAAGARRCNRRTGAGRYDTVGELESIIAQDHPWRQEEAAARIACAIAWGADLGLVGAVRRYDGQLVVFVLETEAAA